MTSQYNSGPCVSYFDEKVEPVKGGGECGNVAFLAPWPAPSSMVAFPNRGVKTDAG